MIAAEEKRLDEHQEADPAEREQHRQRKWASERALGLRDENNNEIVPPPIPGAVEQSPRSATANDGVEKGEPLNESETKSPTAQTERKPEEITPVTEETTEKADAGVTGRALTGEREGLMEITNEDLLNTTTLTEEDLADPEAGALKRAARRNAEEQRDTATAYSRGEIKDKPENYDYWKNRLGLEEPKAKNEMVEAAVKVDKQGNAIDDNGKLIVEQVEKVESITDDDFNNPSRSIELPKIPENVDYALGANGKPVVIKKNIFEKNKKNHPELTTEESRSILIKTLYSPAIVGQAQPKSRPHYWVAIESEDGKSITVLEVNRGKDNIEIVGQRIFPVGESVVSRI